MNDRVTKQLSSCTWLLFSVCGQEFCDTVSQSEIYRGRRDCVGKPCGIAGVDPVGGTYQTKEKRQPFNAGDFCRESRDQCQHSEPPFIKEDGEMLALVNHTLEKMEQLTNQEFAAIDLEDYQQDTGEEP